MSEKTVEIDDEAMEKALDHLETLMDFGETHLSHDEVRPSGHIMATEGKKAYETLIEAHPGYRLNEDG